MSDVKNFLKMLSKVHYPSKKVHSVASMLDYDIDHFLLDLKDELGEKGVVEFCDKAIEKLSGKDGVKVTIDGPDGSEYCYVHIYPVFYDQEESENDVVSNYAWGDSRILSTLESGKETFKTIQEIINEADMADWAELDELLDHIKSQAYNKVYWNCGFGVWWQ
jgi:hypothetical protein